MENRKSEAPTGKNRGPTPFSAVAYSIHSSSTSFPLLNLLTLLNLLNLLILINNTTIPNQALPAGTNPPFPTSQFLQLFDDIHPFHDLSEDDVFPAIYQLQASHVYEAGMRSKRISGMLEIRKIREPAQQTITHFNQSH